MTGRCGEEVSGGDHHTGSELRKVGAALTLPKVVTAVESEPLLLWFKEREKERRERMTEMMDEPTRVRLQVSCLVELTRMHS